MQRNKERTHCCQITMLKERNIVPQEIFLLHYPIHAFSDTLLQFCEQTAKGQLQAASCKGRQLTSWNSKPWLFGVFSGQMSFDSSQLKCLYATLVFKDVLSLATKEASHQGVKVCRRLKSLVCSSFSSCQGAIWKYGKVVVAQLHKETWVNEPQTHQNTSTEG